MSGSVRALFPALFLVACGPGELPGEYFDVTATGTDNGCTGGGAGFNEKFEYRVLLEGNDLTIAIGEDVFATGTVDGCNFAYSSLVWSSYRDDNGVDKEIEWQILGTAEVNVGGGGGCLPDTDWLGEEQYVVITSEHSAVSAGCTYSLELNGKWLKSVEDDGAEAAATGEE